MMHVACNFDEAWSIPAFTMLFSLYKHLTRPEDCTVHVLQKDLPGSVRRLVGRVPLKFEYHAPPEFWKNFKNNQLFGKNPVPLFRLALSEVLPGIDKVLYLDTDLVVNKNLEILYQTDITPFSLAAVREPLLCFSAFPDYAWHNFNSGVMLLNLVKWRNTGLFKRLVSRGEAADAVFADQTILNEVLQHDWLHLDPRWNVLSSFLDENGRTARHLWGDLGWQQLLNDPWIVHYSCPSCKPWMKHTDNVNLRRIVMYDNYRKEANQLA